MVFKKFVEIGGVVYITLGPNAGRLAAIVNVVDENRLLIDGPCSNVERCVTNIKHVKLTNYRLTIPFGARPRTVRKAWEKADINAKWKESSWAKKIELKKRKASLTDFERFKVMRLKQQRRKIIAIEYNKLRKARKASA